MKNKLLVSRMNNKGQVAFPLFLLADCRNAIGNELLMAVCATYVLAFILVIAESFYLETDNWRRTLRISLLCSFSTFIVCGAEIIWLNSTRKFGGLLGDYGVVPTLLALIILLISLTAVSLLSDFAGRKSDTRRREMA